MILNCIWWGASIYENLTSIEVFIDITYRLTLTRNESTPYDSINWLNRTILKIINISSEYLKSYIYLEYLI